MMEQDIERIHVVWADTFTEGDFPHCTVFAISKAICDYGNKLGLKLDFDEVRRNLFQYLKTFQPLGISEGWCPTEFDGIHLPMISSDDDYGNLDISVVKGYSKTFMLEEEYVLMDSRGTKQNCMKVICKMKMGDIRYFLCRENKRNVSNAVAIKQLKETLDPNVEIKDEFDLYIVRVSFNDEFVPPLSDPLFGGNQKHDVDDPTSSNALAEHNFQHSSIELSHEISEYCRNIGIVVASDDVLQMIINEFTTKNELNKFDNVNCCTGKANQCCDILKFTQDKDIEVVAKVEKCNVEPPLILKNLKDENSDSMTSDIQDTSLNPNDERSTMSFRCCDISINLKEIKAINILSNTSEKPVTLKVEGENIFHNQQGMDTPGWTISSPGWKTIP